MLVHRAARRGRRRLLLCLAGGRPIAAWVAVCTLLALTPGLVCAQGVTTIGNLSSFTRAVFLSRDPITAGALPSYTPAKANQGVFSGQGLRTLKRSQAEVKFRDSSVLRIAERTDVILEDTATLRRIQLKAG